VYTRLRLYFVRKNCVATSFVSIFGCLLGFHLPSRRWSTVVEPGNVVVVMNEVEAVPEHVGGEAYQVR